METENRTSQHAGLTAKPRLVIQTVEDAPKPYNAAAIEDLADVVYTGPAGLATALPDADALLLWTRFAGVLQRSWPAKHHLQWVHIAAAGVDSVLFDELRDAPVSVTNAHGVYDEPIAEFVLGSVLAHDKQLHVSKGFQRNAEWRRRELTRTAGKRVLIVGTGGIGRATARLLSAVGLEVRGAGRTERDDDPDFGTVVSSSELAEHAAWADHLVLIAPLTPDTRSIVDAEVLAAMKPSAHLINVGRGALVDEPALVQALQTHRIAAASLDVFATEPLPEEHPFWTMDNVHVSAHMCGDVTGWQDAVADQFLDNLRRFVEGRELRNPVDKERGYAQKVPVPAS
ncbi:D-2-hydroxyacid dehydrogenase [Zhihengliuella sp.]|uniref:D-2-hydroxyacid dehydrogenase n=1 Tax=Zhihengliuella sp. TaxID=1954483 RepID=UPI0028109E8F|nr:D-2-hydroxyacid dehydrogenase [Zhihengliuella sp.]